MSENTHVLHRQIAQPMGGTIDGRLGDHVLLAPPFSASDDDLDRIVERLQAALVAALSGVSARAVAVATGDA